MPSEAFPISLRKLEIFPLSSIFLILRISSGKELSTQASNSNVIYGTAYTGFPFHIVLDMFFVLYFDSGSYLSIIISIWSLFIKLVFSIFSSNFDKFWSPCSTFRTTISDIRNISNVC